MINPINNIEEFNSLSFQEKLSIFDAEKFTEIVKLKDAVLYDFLKRIIFNTDENPYIREKVTQSLVFFVLNGDIKKGRAINILIDEWTATKETFLEITRLKILFFLYDITSEEDQIFLNLGKCLIL